MTDEEITAAILSVDENDELSKDMVEQVFRNCATLELCSSRICHSLSLVGGGPFSSTL